MPTGKRASMREGPLAALFRKTSEDVEPEPASPSAPAQPQPARPEAPPVTSSVERSRGRGREPRREREPRMEHREPPREPAPPVEPERVAEPPEPRLPSPQERLRNAFSLD